MRTVSRPRPFQTCRDTDVVAHLKKREDVEDPRALIEIAGKKAATIAVDQRVNARRDVP
jgi:hypothetical protein